jgi:hypothetical protein
MRGLGCMVQGAGCRVQGLGRKPAPFVESPTLESDPALEAFRIWNRDERFSVQDSGKMLRVWGLI